MLPSSAMTHGEIETGKCSGINTIALPTIGRWGPTSTILNAQYAGGFRAERRWRNVRRGAYLLGVCQSGSNTALHQPSPLWNDQTAVATTGTGENFDRL